MIDFSSLDFLYRNSPNAYRDLLLFIVSELGEAKIKFVNYLLTKDTASFNHLKHKLISTLNTIGARNLLEVLDASNTALLSGQSQFREEIEHLEHHFDLLIRRFEEKLQAMETEKVM